MQGGGLLHCNRACSELIIIRTIALHPLTLRSLHKILKSFPSTLRLLLVFWEAREAQFNTGSEFCFPFKYPAAQNPPLQRGRTTWRLWSSLLWSHSSNTNLHSQVLWLKKKQTHQSTTNHGVFFWMSAAFSECLELLHSSKSSLEGFKHSTCQTWKH